MIRLLIEDVTLTKLDEPWSISVAIRWRTGALSRHRAKRPLRHPQTTAPEVIDRIQALYEEKTDEEIAALLNAEDYESGYGKPFTPAGVTHIRNRRGLKKPRNPSTRSRRFVH